MPGKHAILSASGASIWMTCGPAGWLQQQFPEQESTEAAEGTDAHHLSEAKALFRLGDISKREYQHRYEDVREGEYYTREMDDLTDDYSSYVIEQYNRARRDHRDAFVFIEQKLKLDHWIPEGFGTGDAGVFARSVFEEIDLKYGKGLLVPAVDNTQLKIYALGALRKFDPRHEVKTVLLTIYQPRLDNIDTWEMRRKDLDEWAEDVLVPAAERAWAGKGRFVPGDHCRFCRARGACDALREYNMELANFDFIDASLMTPEDVAFVLKRVDGLVKWANDVKEYALYQAINAGQKYPGFKIVEGRSNRKFEDEAHVIRYLTSFEGVALEDLTRVEMNTLETLKKTLGKRTFETIVAPLLTKPPGKLALVPKDHKSPEWHSSSAARSVDWDADERDD